MNDNDISILIASGPDYEKLTAEIYYQDKFIALLSQEEGLDYLKIEFPGTNVIEDMVLRNVDLAIFEKALAQAKQKLTNA